MSLEFYSNELFELLSRMRQKLLELGPNTIATLPKVFKSKPSYDNNADVNVQDFFEGLQMYGLHIIKEEAVLLCRYFDQTGTRVFF